MRSYWRDAVVLFASFLVASAATAGVPNGGTLRVDDDAPPGGDGLTWDTAYRFLQDALANASGGGISEIRVAQGTYRPDEDEANPDGTGNREATFQLINNVALMGGYAGIGAVDPNARDFELYVTALDGNIGAQGSPNDNSLHIVKAQSEIEAALLDGFTIQNGRADDSDPPHGKDGGGILNDGGEITLTNCKLTSNFGLDFGAGAYVGGGGTITAINCSFVENVGEDGGGITAYSGGTIIAEKCLFESNSSSLGAGALVWGNGNASFTDCTFSANTALVSGAVEIRIQSTAQFESCVFENNIAENDAGALRLIESVADITNCTFVNNEAAKDKPGGALRLGDSVASIAHSTFVGNSAQAGGAIYLLSSEVQLSDCEFRANIGWQGFAGIVVGNSLLEARDCLFADNHAIQNWAGAVGFSTGFESKMTNCVFVGNTAPLFGGGVSMIESEPQFTNCLFVGNAADEGGAMYINQSQPNLIDCTFANNIAEENGGGFFSDGFQSFTTMANCIFWGNSDPGGTDQSAQIFIDDGVVHIDFSCIQGLTGSLGGIGNIGDDPLFVDPDGLDDVPGSEDDDLRLSPGSPCIDAADNTAVPPDVFDLDDDDDIDEPIPFDLDGNPRFVDDPDTRDTGNGDPPIVDMGPYEFQVAGIIEASLDIKPGSCPNSFNRNSHGMLPAAILGNDDFDAAQIDISSISLSRSDGIGGSIAPNEGPPGPHSVLDDVATPFDGEPCDCHELGGDGLTDLVMHFSSPELVETLELNDLPADAQVLLTVSGELIDGSPFTATDCIRLVPAGDLNGDGDVGSLDLIILLDSWGSCAECIDCPTDLDGECTVGVAELIILLSTWG